MKPSKRKWLKQLEQRKLLKTKGVKSTIAHLNGDYKGEKLKGDTILSSCSLSSLERKSRGNLYTKGNKYLRRLIKNKSISIDVIALKTANPKNKPYLHLTLKNIDKLYPRNR